MRFKNAYRPVCAIFNVLVIATSAFREEQLSDSVKQRFNNIVSIESHKEQPKISWLEKNKIAYMITAGFVCCALAAIYIGTQILSATIQLQQHNQNILLNQKIIDLSQSISCIRETYNEQIQSVQNQQLDMQKELDGIKKRR